MKPAAAKKMRRMTDGKPLTLEEIHKTFETDFEKVKDLLHLTEEHLHHDSNRINNQMAEIIREERDQKRNLSTLISVIMFLNVITAISGIVVVSILVS